MTTDVSTDIKKGVNGSLWTGVLLIVLGWGVAVPAVSTIVAETWIALILISAELPSWSTRFKPAAQGFIWKLLSGLYIATGVMLFVYPRASSR